MMAPFCVVSVGHPPGTPATWQAATNPEFTVCDRHRAQYDERDDLGPYAWRPASESVPTLSDGGT